MQNPGRSRRAALSPACQGRHRPRPWLDETEEWSCSLSRDGGAKAALSSTSMSVTAVLYLPSRPEAASSLYHTLLARVVISLSVYTYSMNHLIDALTAFIQNLYVVTGLAGIVPAMALESCCIPLPS